MFLWFHFCFFPMEFIDEGEISGGASATHTGRPLHGNSYELSEFDARGPTYRYVLNKRSYYVSNQQQQTSQSI